MADAIITPHCDFLVTAFFSTPIKKCLLKLFIAIIYLKIMKIYKKKLYRNLLWFCFPGWFSLNRPSEILLCF